MTLQYLDRVPFGRALMAQNEAAVRAARGEPATLIGFESEPVVTLGLRARDADLTVGRERLRALGVDLVRVDRGGRATLHNPGQVVIFPVGPVGPRGSRAWVDRLITCTRDVARDFGQELTWDEARPGLYADDGAKVAAIGLRIRRGISTHGLAINVRNDLAQFELIRACGITGAPLAHLATTASPREVFDAWAARFLRDEG